MEIFRTENLTFTYAGKTEPTIEDISIQINRGEFITICGATGSGKSTFLKLLKEEISPKGDLKGNIYFKGKQLNYYSSFDKAALIGYVSQKPEHQLVTDKVWRELAFGLENLNVQSNVILSRISEMSAYFGIEHLYDEEIDNLSGGQKQILNVASIMSMSPEVLLLDEPTSQLDPISTMEFISMLQKINRDLGVTVVIIEHRLEELIPISDKIVFFEKGKVVAFESPKIISSKIAEYNDMSAFFPVPTRLAYYLGCVDNLPLDLKSGRLFIENEFINEKSQNIISDKSYINDNKYILEISQLFFRYQRDKKDVLSYLNLSVKENEIFCLLGGNGSGKSTLLSVISGLLKQYSGVIKINDKKIKEYKNNSLYLSELTLLPQDVQVLFSEDRVDLELKNSPYLEKLPENIRNSHPYDLSIGEQQIIAFYKILQNNPKLILLDEPTKGIDPTNKQKLKELILELKKEGKTIFIVTHDIEFAAECADRCGLIFNGRIVSVDDTRTFFSNNKFYTTASHKMSSHILKNAVTLDDLICYCEKNGKKIK